MEVDMQKNNFKVISSFKRKATELSGADVDKAYVSCKPLIEAEKKRFAKEVGAIQDFSESNLMKLGWDIIK